MDPFRDRAAAILELAQVGYLEHLTVLFHDNGPGVPPGLHLIVGGPSAVSPAAASRAPRNAATASYKVTRASGTVLVRGDQGVRSCELSAPVLRALPAPFQLNNQALYHLASPLLPGVS